MKINMIKLLFHNKSECNSVVLNPQFVYGYADNVFNCLGPGTHFFPLECQIKGNEYYVFSVCIETLKWPLLNNASSVV